MKNIKKRIAIKKCIFTLTLAFIICFTLIPMPVTAAASELSLDKSFYAPNEEMFVTVSNITQQMVDDDAYVSIYRKGASHSDYMSWKRPEAGSSQLGFWAPHEPGTYEMRLYRRDYEYTDDTFVMSVPFTVLLQKQGKLSLERAAYQALQRIPVTVTEITQEMEKSEAYVAIYKKDSKHEDYISYKYVTSGNSVVELTAPNLNGEFEMRLYSIDHNYTDESFVMSVPFTLSGAVEQQSSEWAKTEIQKAAEMGLIPNSLKNADLTKPITRAEFAAVSVKLYEKLSGNSAAASATNPFTDTKDVEVLKAYNADITTGIAADKFAPDQLLNREQAAVMLTRVFKKSFVQGWTLNNDDAFTFNYAAPPKFADDAKISDWAKPSVYFMASHGIISGVGNNNFAPKATTSAEQAANYAGATREQALAISVRMTENLDKTDAKEILPPAIQPETKNGSIVGKWSTGMTGAMYNIGTGSFDFGMYGIGEEYHFNSNGTFVELITSGLGTAVSITGNYTINESSIAFTYTGSKTSSDFGKTWAAGNIPENSSRYYELGADNEGSYLLISLEGTTLPLDTSTNAVKYYNE